jgi:hypothetical protein
VLLALHVAAILFYLLFKKRNLVKPMVVGSNEADLDAPVPADAARARPLAPVIALGVALSTVAAVSWH